MEYRFDPASPRPERSLAHLRSDARSLPLIGRSRRAAAQLGLQQAGFLNISTTADITGPVSLLDLMRSAAPEIFDNQVEIRAIAVVAEELETSDEEEATEA